MATIEQFFDIQLADLMPLANRKKADGWRAVQLFCTNTEDGIDMSYTFNKEGVWENYRIKGITKDTVVPSIQRLYFGMFPFENESADLFGVKFEGMVLDFAGKFYNVAENEPMTFISPEQQVAKEKAKKAAAAKAAKEAEAKSAGAPEAAAVPVPMTDEEIEAKVAAVSPDKADKVRAALKAKQKKDIAAVEAAKAAAAPAKKGGLTPEEIEKKLAGMDPEKAAKARAALEAKAKRDAAQAGKDGE